MIEVFRVKNNGRNRCHHIAGEYYYQPVVNGISLCNVAETYDVAMLIALEHKYTGLNSQFTRFACRMLGIDSVWSK